MKALITHRMHETHDSLRLVFATEAYGTGIDVPDIKQIIHVGPPNTMESKNTLIIDINHSQDVCFSVSKSKAF